MHFQQVASHNNINDGENTTNSQINNTLFSWSHEEKIATNVDPEKIWRLWSSVSTWHLWDHALESVQLTGDFAAGSHGTLRPKGGSDVAYTILQAQKNHSFRDRSLLPLTTLDFSHRIENGVLCHRAEMRGWLTPLFARIIGRKIRTEMRVAMQNLLLLAEKTPIQPQ